MGKAKFAYFYINFPTYSNLSKCSISWIEMRYVLNDYFSSKYYEMKNIREDIRVLNSSSVI